MSLTPTRWIAHLDMDSFYASVELLRYPELKGKPVVIGGGRRAAPIANSQSSDARFEFKRLREYVGRGVITTATYAAREFGVHSGMGLMKAAKLAPDAYLLPTDFDEYRRYSRMFKDAVAEIAPHIEDRGIDEIYIDLTQLPGVNETIGVDPLGGVRAIALAIKNNVRVATGLPCSIGVSPNKLLSKIASELEKPDGLTIITSADIERRIWPLPARRINGIGPKADLKLAQLGIRTIGQLANTPAKSLVEHFGKSFGEWMHEAANGHDDRAVVTYSEPKSISRETTFDRDMHVRQDREQLSIIFTKLCEKLADDLKRKGYRGRTIGVKLRFDDFKIVTRDSSIASATDDAIEIRRAATECLKRVGFDRRLRLLGVRMGGLTKSGEVIDAHIVATADSDFDRANRKAHDAPLNLALFDD